MAFDTSAGEAVGPGAQMLPRYMKSSSFTSAVGLTAADLDDERPRTGAMYDNTGNSGNGNQLFLSESTGLLTTAGTMQHNVFLINVALSSIPAPRRGYACRSRQVSTEPPLLTDAGSIFLRASAVHSLALSATYASLTDSASLRRSSRINFGVPRPHLCDPTTGVMIMTD